MEKLLGKISEVKFGFGGYQGAMIGISISLRFSDSTGTACGEHMFMPNDDSPPTESHWENAYIILDKVHELLVKSKKQTVDELVGVPVEAEFDGMMLKKWRILEEVL